MKEGDMPSQNLADFCSLSFTLLSSYREPITSYAFNDKEKKQTKKVFSQIQFTQNTSTWTDHFIKWNMEKR